MVSNDPIDVQRQARKDMRRAIINWLHVSNGDTSGIEYEVTKAILNVTGRLEYCDIHG